MLNYEKEMSPRDLDIEFQKITEKLRALKLPSGFFDCSLYIISEIFENVKVHSKAKKVNFSMKLGENDCKIKIRDNGIGLRESYIRKRIYPKDDFSAVDFALSGLSTKNLEERGFGLYSIKGLVEESKGSLVIKTGQARVIVEKKRKALEKCPEERGVSVEIKIPLQPIDFYKTIK